jgi:hypothetical protein
MPLIFGAVYRDDADASFVVPSETLRIRANRFSFINPGAG